ncbi:deoxyribose-phosphate aldolase [Pseudotamlana carrageenivorans]|uniref:Deoxyribose-phosphate aldolase n=1 Tax=Pseudotamlana carrageenivorans TaxID=2069432 RepID=A0A2I7SDP6_9FLAO|nr:deoxyribose-phosphate aldolase [Tamlana carrageenivorans]AUS04021.1 deoxyribose-phosphate aldolase [Tamlana carrageenivorans]
MNPFSPYIDHTLLKATATKEDIITLCKEAEKYDFFSVCVNSSFVSTAKKALNNSKVKVCSVVGFPLGAMSTEAKVAETQSALKDGADEIDMVINIGLLKSKDYQAVEHDIAAIKHIMPHQVLKVILETCYLEDSEILKASEIAIKAGADFIKTSTGFGTRGASTNDIKIMKSACTKDTKIKASGGIRDAETALHYINLGVKRLGTSSGIAIVNGTTSNSNY